VRIDRRLGPDAARRAGGGDVRQVDTERVRGWPPTCTEVGGAHPGRGSRNDSWWTCCCWTGRRPRRRDAAVPPAAPGRLRLLPHPRTTTGSAGGGFLRGDRRGTRRAVAHPAEPGPDHTVTASSCPATTHCRSCWRTAAGGDVRHRRRAVGTLLDVESGNSPPPYAVELDVVLDVADPSSASAGGSACAAARTAPTACGWTRPRTPTWTLPRSVHWRSGPPGHDAGQGGLVTARRRCRGVGRRLHR